MGPKGTHDTIGQIFDQYTIETEPWTGCMEETILFIHSEENPRISTDHPIRSADQDARINTLILTQRFDLLMYKGSKQGLLRVRVHMRQDEDFEACIG